MTYLETIVAKKNELEARAAAGAILHPNDIFDSIDWREDNRPLLEWARKEHIITSRDVTRAAGQAAHRRTVAETLGGYPASAPEYIDLLAHMTGVKIAFNGAMSRVDMETGGTIGLIITDFARDARITASALGLSLSRDDINDAADSWYHRAKRDRLTTIRQTLAPRRQFDWVELADRCFDTSTTGSEFVAAVLRKFVHQVVSKLHGKPVDWHLMPILTGGQGGGKTYFVNKLCGPLVELKRNVDFRTISDERIIEVWSSYILFLDEMAHADRADVETVKNVITADALDRRPMRSNNMVQVHQSATLIACSNKDVGEMIKDETGARRFAPIAFTGCDDKEYLSSLDWQAAWQSIKHTDADPMAEFRSQLTAIQEEARHRSPVELWIAGLRDHDAREIIRDVGALRLGAMYQHYLSHRRDVTGDRDPTTRTQDQFAREISRLDTQKPADLPFRKSKDRNGVFYQWKNQSVYMSLLDGGRK